MVVLGRPMFRGYPVRGSAAGCIHPFACPRPWPGGMGRVRVRWRSGGANHGGALPPWGGGQNGSAASRLAEGRMLGGLAPGRVGRRPGHAAVAGAAGLARQRICPSRMP